MSKLSKTTNNLFINGSYIQRKGEQKRHFNEGVLDNILQKQTTLYSFLVQTFTGHLLSFFDNVVNISVPTITQMHSVVCENALVH